MSYPNFNIRNLQERVNNLERIAARPPQSGPSIYTGIVKAVVTSGSYGYIEVIPMFNRTSSLPLYISNGTTDDGALQYWNNSGNFENSLTTYQSGSDQQYVRVYLNNMPSKYWGGFYQVGDDIDYWESWVPATNTFSNQMVTTAYVAKAGRKFWASITGSTSTSSTQWSYKWQMMQTVSTPPYFALVTGGWTDAKADGDVAINTMEALSNSTGVQPSGITLPLYTGCPLSLKPIGVGAIVEMKWGRDENGDIVFNFSMPNVID